MSELVTPEELAAAQVSRYNPALNDWNSLIAEADEILGYELAKDELADELVGIPFIVTRMQFRPGVNRPTGEMKDGKPVLKQGAYCTFECVLAPEFNLTRINVARSGSGLGKLLTLEVVPFGPGEHVVLNDGSTGLYRQGVEYLAAKGYIVLPEPIVATGPMGMCSYDLIPDEWQDIRAGEIRYDEDGFGLYEVQVRLFAKRGLRLSEYENEYTAPGEQAKTRYFA